MKKKNEPQVTPDSSAESSHCGWTGSQAEFKLHLRCWDDDANPIRPQCPGVRFFIDPDPDKWKPVDRYTVLTRRNILAGMKPKKAAREAAIAVGFRERAEPMSDDVKAMLKERNERERDIKRGMKKRTAAKKRRGRRRRA